MQRPEIVAEAMEIAERRRQIEALTAARARLASRIAEIDSQITRLQSEVNAYVSDIRTVARAHS